VNKVKLIVTLTGYQIVWFSCVLGEKYYPSSLLGFLVGIIFYLFYFSITKNKTRFFKISLCIVIPGYLFDTMMIYFSIYKFNTLLNFGLLPIWMISLWLSFSTLFDEILLFFINYKIVGIVLGAIFATFTYYSGIFLGIIFIENTYIFFTIMFMFWSLLMYYYLNILLKKIT